MAEHIPQEDDKELLAAFREDATRERAYTKIVKKYQERLYWHVRRMVINHEDANDVLQNVFIKVWTYLENFREESNLYTWMYRIATNETLTFLEKEKKRASLSFSDHESGLSNKLHAEKGFDANKLEWRLQQAIQSLPTKQKAVFLLRYYEEMPYEEMSKVLETSTGALKASYHHAVKKVEEFLKQD
ncbi:RNA polymerase subunit sigma [Taibaiella sp. KBW10]|uniref:RNA polymerase sigma factor n=1 Tax=Taibaiella sp. KBW10 TaxID=2153357 RepID=UPI000F5AD756|nr:sigma-70 family RNA polymerase sigma factor [Taibaiella sp. KBW10]RQO32302.1 RNA polymerase subunit sigma [Taibaiella sp. KBW10]